MIPGEEVPDKKKVGGILVADHPHVSEQEILRKSVGLGP